MYILQNKLYLILSFCFCHQLLYHKIVSTISIILGIGTVFKGFRHIILYIIDCYIIYFTEMVIWCITICLYNVFTMVMFSQKSYCNLHLIIFLGRGYIRKISSSFHSLIQHDILIYCQFTIHVYVNITLIYITKFYFTLHYINILHMKI